MATGTADEIEEERRLLYVAMTRAKDELDLISPQRFFVRQQSAHGDRHVYALRSRFIADSLAALFDSCAFPIEPSTNVEHAPELCEPAPPIDVAARVRARWSRSG
jgi:DNA helicase-2/ATP-dependent DNA helicase PcrA